jgi:arylsulfatase A-like enzyme
MLPACIYFILSILLFAAMVTAMDAAIGEVVKALQDSGQYENTIIVFTSDVRI